MTSYRVTLSEAELAVVSLALGRFLSPTKIAERKPAGPKRYAHKVGKLSPSQQTGLVGRWADAVERAGSASGSWSDALAWGVVRDGLGYSTAEAVRKAWGIAA